MATTNVLPPGKIPVPTAISSKNMVTGQFVGGTPTWVQPMITAASQKYGVPTSILSALLKQESGFNPNVISKAGAQGIAQFMPGTAKSYGINPFDPQQAVNAAAQYIRSSLNTFGGDMSKALASYNAGVGAVQQYGGIPPYEETQNYVKNILAMAGQPSTDATSTTNPVNYAMPQPQVAGASTSQVQTPSALSTSSSQTVPSSMTIQSPAPAPIPDFSASNPPVSSGVIGGSQSNTPAPGNLPISSQLQQKTPYQIAYGQ